MTTTTTAYGHMDTPLEACIVPGDASFLQFPVEDMCPACAFIFFFCVTVPNAHTSRRTRASREGLEVTVEFQISRFFARWRYGVGGHSPLKEIRFSTKTHALHVC